MGKLMLERYEDIPVINLHEDVDADNNDLVDDADDLPEGWETAMDEQKKKSYYWRVDNPKKTKTFKKPKPSQALKTKGKGKGKRKGKEDEEESEEEEAMDEQKKKPYYWR